MEWLALNWQVLAAIGAGVFGVVALIVKLTPSTKDDEVVGKIGDAVDPFLPGDQSSKKPE